MTTINTLEIRARNLMCAARILSRVRFGGEPDLVQFAMLIIEERADLLEEVLDADEEEEEESA